MVNSSARVPLPFPAEAGAREWDLILLQDSAWAATPAEAEVEADLGHPKLDWTTEQDWPGVPDSVQEGLEEPNSQPNHQRCLAPAWALIERARAGLARPARGWRPVLDLKLAADEALEKGSAPDSEAALQELPDSGKVTQRIGAVFVPEER